MLPSLFLGQCHLGYCNSISLHFFKEKFKIIQNISCFEFIKNNYTNINNSIILIDTGSRNRDEINRNQKIIQKLSRKKIDNLKKLRDLSMATSDFLNQGDIDSIGKLIARSWEIKQATHINLFTPKIKNSLNSISNLGAKSFKLLGSGKGGFIFVYERNPKIRKELIEYFNQRVLRVGIDKTGLVNLENGML